MSRNPNGVQNWEACLDRLDWTYKMMAEMLMKKPQCLKDHQRKPEVVQMIILNLSFKIERSKAEGKEKTSRKSAITLATLVECFDESNNREYARKVMENLFDLSVQELRYVPTNIKDRAFQICKQLLEGEI